MIYDSFLPENTIVLQQSQKAITIYLYFQLFKYQCNCRRSKFGQTFTMADQREKSHVLRNETSHWISTHWSNYFKTISRLACLFRSTTQIRKSLCLQKNNEGLCKSWGEIFFSLFKQCFSNNSFFPILAKLTTEVGNTAKTKQRLHLHIFEI